MEFGVEHDKLKLYIFNINDDPEVVLIYFTTMSNMENLAFVLYGRPRYQVSVYRTIGPLV